MHTLRLRVNDRVYHKLIGLLSKFSKDEVEVIPENHDFIVNQKYLSGELNEILNGKAKFMEMEEVEKRLKNIIRNNENCI